MPNKPRSACARLAIVMEGGLIQAVIADDPDAAPAFAVIDYDTEGFEPDELREITQHDGTLSTAVVIDCYVEAAGIDLDEVFTDPE